MKHISGGVSQAHRVLLEKAIEDDAGLVTVGLLMNVRGKQQLLRFTIEDPIADELGQKQLLDVKGASGLKPCFKCTNVFMKGHPLATLPGHVSICAYNPATFWKMEDADLWNMQDELARDHAALRRGLHGMFEDKQTFSGVNFSPHGLLASIPLRQHTRPTKHRFDRMHNQESGGVAELEINLLVESLATSRLYSNAQLTEYCNAGWKIRGSAVKLKFKDNKLKGQAAEVLTAMPILHEFVLAFLQAWEPDKVASFKALFACHKQLQYIKMSGDVSRSSTSKLTELFSKHLELFEKAWGEDEVKPKHHYDFHLGEQYFEDKVYMDCFPTERHQKLIKAIADHFRDDSNLKHEFFVLSRANRCQVEEVASLYNDSGVERNVMVDGVAGLS